MDVIKELMTKGAGQEVNLEEYQETHQDFDFDTSRAVAANTMKIKIKEKHDKKLKRQADRDEEIRAAFTNQVLVLVTI